jgi:hypothetical protein
MATQKELIESLISEIANLKNSLPNGNILKIEQSLNEMHKNQSEMKKDMRTIQKRLFNPDSGLIVETNKNTDFRETCAPEREELIGQFKDVLRWKRMVEGGLAIVFTSIVGVIVKLIFF